MIEQFCENVNSLLLRNMPNIWDGKESILFMRDNNCRNWRQMEWPGWYFQFMCEVILENNGIMEIPGPSFGNVEFDGFGNIPWDFKAHSNNSGSKVPTNGFNEILEAIKEYGKVGFIIACGDIIYDDDDQSFKKWHDSLKGGRSNYESDRISRGAPSRRRKNVFRLSTIEYVFLDSETIKYCLSFQGNFRNSDGSPRNQKVMIDLNDQRIEKYVYKV